MAGAPARVARVLPDVAAVRKTFDYEVPPRLEARLADGVQVGAQVRIDLHGRRVAGWVVATGVTPPEGVTLRPLAGVRGIGPPPAVVALADWAAWRWAGAASTVLRTASPERAVRALPTPGPAPRLVAGARYGASGGELAEIAAAALAGGVSVLRLAPALSAAPVVDAAAALLDRGGDNDGDGDGDRPGVLVLTPSMRTAAAVARRMRTQGRRVALLPDDWAVARAGGCVAVGARAAAFAPLPRLLAAVVLDAHDEAHHQEQAPTWSAWVVAAERARRDGAPCVLVSAAPTLELLAAAGAPGGRLVTTGRALERRGWPRLQVVDRRADDPRTGLYSEALVTLLRQAAGAPAGPGARLVCVLNRTGRARLLACATCASLACCERCDGPLESVEAQDAPGATPQLRCRRCAAAQPVVCRSCGGVRMKALRVGVRRVREELQALAGVPVAEMTGEDAAAPGPAPAEAPIVVGTEAALHRLDAADAVAFLHFDAELLAPRLHAGEEALALLVRAARLVARRPGGDRGGGADDDHGGRSPGRVLVQTRLPDHPVVEAAVTADPARLAAVELEVRRALRLPPARALATVSGAGADAYAAALVSGAPPAVEVRGPTDGVWSVLADDHHALCDLLAATARPPGRLRVEVDPVRV